MNRRRFLSSTAALFALPRVARAVPTPLSPARRLHLVNAHNGETFESAFRDENGPITGVLVELSYFLRDQHSGAWTEMDVGVLDFLADVMAETGQKSATILSGFRTRETNEMLARTTFGVAENSQHIYGRALDIHFEAKLADAMKTARGMKRGGVGWYPHSNFIHIDNGPVRNWDLDDDGLRGLLGDGQRLSLNGRGELLVKGPGRIVIGGGREPVVLHGSNWPLSDQVRLNRLHQLARAEFVIRRRGM